LALLGSLLIFAAVNVRALLNANEALNTHDNLESTWREETLVRSLIAAVREAETQQRGFLLTSDEAYLSSYTNGVTAVGDTLRTLRSLAGGNREVEKLEDLTAEKMADLGATIALKREQSRDTTPEIERSGRGLLLMQQIGSTGDAIILDLERALSRYLAARTQALRAMQRIIVFSFVIALLLTSFGIYFVLKEIRRRLVETELHAREKHLADRVAERTFELFQQTETLQLEILQRRGAELALREAEKRLKLALDLSGTVVWTYKVADGSTIWSGPVLQVFGKTAGELSSLSEVRKLVAQEDIPLLQHGLSDSVLDRNEYSAEFRVTKPDNEIHWISNRGGTVLDAEGHVALISGISSDVTERRQTQQQLEASEKHFRQLAEAMPQVVWTANANGEFDYYNSRWYRLTGLPENSISQRQDQQQVLHPSDFQPWVTAWSEACEHGRPYEIEYRFWDVEKQQFRWHLGRAVPVRDSHEAVTRWFGTCTDIHEQKTSNERLENEIQVRTADLQRSLQVLREKEDELRSSLVEKETLLREVHHRVKNNLQVISSLLRMQAGAMHDREAESALKDSQQRVISMALIHERLYGSHQMDSIDFEEYATALVNELFSNYAVRADRVATRFITSRVLLNIDQAIPCGLILNELVSNALKHAYPNGESGAIVVGLAETSSGQVILSVSDQGVGLPQGSDWTESTSLGLAIVQILAKQICGELHLGSGPGVEVTLEFSRDKSAAATA
jgi:PAS domain S-box-containing protein